MEQFDNLIDACLNPYSTGSNSNKVCDDYFNNMADVLILILLEVTQITDREYSSHLDGEGLNPYSTGSNSNKCS